MSIRTAARLIAAGVLLLALADMPYGYYQFLRIFVSAVALYEAGIWLSKVGNERTFWTISFGITVIVFNPFLPLDLEREEWAWANVFGAALFLGSFLPELKYKLESKSDSALVKDDPLGLASLNFDEFGDGQDSEIAREVNVMKIFARSIGQLVESEYKTIELGRFTGLKTDDVRTAYIRLCGTMSAGVSRLLPVSEELATLVDSRNVITADSVEEMHHRSTRLIMLSVKRLKERSAELRASLCARKS